MNAAAAQRVIRDRWLARVGRLGPTTRGWGVLIAAAVSLLAANWWALGQFNYIGCLLGGLMLFATAYVLLGHSRVGIERRFSPGVVTAGDQLTVTVVVRNLSALPILEAHWRDSLGPGLVANASGSMPALGSGRSLSPRVEFGYDVRARRRGIHAIGPLTISVCDPFGLIACAKSHGASTPVTVLPAFIELPQAAFSMAGTDGSLVASERRMGLGVDDVIARQFVPGDPVRHLHWKATARRGELMVRQEEKLDNPKVTVILDTDIGNYRAHPHVRDQGDGYLPEFEWAVIKAASVCSGLISSGFEVVFRSELILRDVGNGMHADAFRDVLADLAAVEPTDRSLPDGCLPDDDVLFDLKDGPPRTVIAILGAVSAQRAALWAEVDVAGVTAVALTNAHCSKQEASVLRDAGWLVQTAANADGLLDNWIALDAGAVHAKP